MPRKLDKKVIQSRVKENKAKMKEHKAIVLAEIKSASQNVNADAYKEKWKVDKTRARNSLNQYIEAALAITKDNEKLDQLKQKQENTDA